MKIKKYTAPSMPEAMKKVRAELGSQAVILQSKTVYTGGVLGLFKKKNIEVVAAIDPNAPAPVKQMEAAAIPLPAAPPVSTVRSQQPAGVPADLKREMNEMKKMIMELKESAASELIYPEVVKPVIEKLERHGVSRELQLLTANYLLEKWSKEKDGVNEQLVQNWAVSFLSDCLPSSQPLQKETVKYIYLLGPTGVGKTTTLAKLASHKVLEENKKAAFITTDTYRIAAIEQLKTYAGLLQTPVKVAYSQDDMKPAFADLLQSDVVFIDTAGRNYREKNYVEDLYRLVMERPGESSYFLVLSAAAKEEDLQEIIENFSPIKLDGFIFTKVDETKTKGVIINLMHQYKIGTSFITNGQNVPNDITETSSEMIVKLLFED